MAEEHDKTHRLIFSFPRMVADLIRLVVGGDWVKRLDFSTLEKVPERLLSPELLRREQDVFWRLAYKYPENKKYGRFFLYVHIEHQSRPRRRMSLYTTAYKALAMQDLSRRGSLVLGKKLPQIISLVYYTGESRWKVPTSLLDEVQTLPEAPDGLDLWSYRLIDARRYPVDDILGEASPLVGLFQLSQATSFEDLGASAKEISNLLGPEDEELRQAFVTMINEEICPRLAKDGEEPRRFNELEEFPTMLEQTMDSIIHRLEMKGEANIFQELFTARFGEVPGWVRQRIADAKKGQLATWAKRLLTSERPEDVFD